jgi:acyl carrier protein
MLGLLLARIDELPPAITYADLAGALASLPGQLRHPARLDLAVKQRDVSAAPVSRVWLRSVAEMPESEALAMIREGVTAELARILRAGPGAIDAQRPLDQLGMDSLMIMEFKMAFETRFGVELPFLSISAFRNPEDITRRILWELRGNGSSGSMSLSPEEQRLLEAHRAGPSTAETEASA